nr:uncharacterized protein LOC109744194 isoform X2 [Aegilops tauschii subsp. strangulata]
MGRKEAQVGTVKGLYGPRPDLGKKKPGPDTTLSRDPGATARRIRRRRAPPLSLLVGASSDTTQRWTGKPPERRTQSSIEDRLAAAFYLPPSPAADPRRDPLIPSRRELEGDLEVQRCEHGGARSDPHHRRPLLPKIILPRRKKPAPLLELPTRRSRAAPERWGRKSTHCTRSAATRLDPTKSLVKETKPLERAAAVQVKEEASSRISPSKLPRATTFLEGVSKLRERWSRYNTLGGSKRRKRENAASLFVSRNAEYVAVAVGNRIYILRKSDGYESPCGIYTKVIASQYNLDKDDVLKACWLHSAGDIHDIQSYLTVTSFRSRIIAVMAQHGTVVSSGFVYCGTTTCWRHSWELLWEGRYKAN